MEDSIFWTLEEHLSLRLLMHDISCVFDDMDRRNVMHPKLKVVKDEIFNGHHRSLADNLQALCEKMNVPVSDYLPVDVVKDVRSQLLELTGIDLDELYLKSHTAAFAVVEGAVYGTHDSLKSYPEIKGWLSSLNLESSIFIVSELDGYAYAEELVDILSVKVCENGSVIMH